MWDGDEKEMMLHMHSFVTNNSYSIIYPWFRLSILFIVSPVESLKEEFSLLILTAASISTNSMNLRPLHVINTHKMVSN